MNPGTRFLLLVLGGFWFPLGLRAGSDLARANGFEHASSGGAICLAMGVLSFGWPWLLAAFMSRILPPRLGLILSAGVLFVPFWGMVRWVNVHYLPSRTDPASYLGNLGMAVLLLASWWVLVSLTRVSGPPLTRGLSTLAVAGPGSRRQRLSAAAIMLAVWSLAAWPLVASRGKQGAPAFGPADTGIRLCLVGIDGATWDVINPMLARGELPHLRRLMSEGHFGPLATLEHWSSSPVLWSTMATGTLPRKHGIQFFVATIHHLPLADEWVTIPPTASAPLLTAGFRFADMVGMSREEKVPVNGTMRRRPALWEILSAAGRRSLVLNWWATWPAVSINGVIVSDMVDLMLAQHFGVAERADYAYLEGIPHLVHPPEMTEELTILLEEAAALAENEWRGLLPARDAGDPPGGGDASARERLDHLDPDRPLSYLKFGYLSDRTTLHLAERFLTGGEDYDFFCVYFRGLDWVEHYLWDAMEPEFFPPECPGVGDPSLSAAIPAYYRFMDRSLGKLDSLLDERTVMMVVSDHGHRKALPFGVDGDHRGTHSLRPHPAGIILVKGPSLRPNNQVMITGASLPDLVPTALYLLGLPLARDLDGDLIGDVVDPALLAERPPRLVETYRGLGSLSPSPQRSPLDSQAEERLRSLGYLH